MCLVLCMVFVALSASVAEAGARCPPGYVVARYSFGIWVCKLPIDPRLACPPGKHLAEDHLGTPKCVWNRPRAFQHR